MRERFGDVDLRLVAELLDATPHAEEVRFVAVDHLARIAHLHITLLERQGRLAAGTVLDVFTVGA